MTASCQAFLSITNSWSLLKLLSVKSVMPSNHLILCHPLHLPLQSFQASGSFPMSQFFAWCPKYWSFSFIISPSNKYSGLISFGIDWLDLLAVQETLKSLLQHHRSKASILWHSAFFMAQLFHLYKNERESSVVSDSLRPHESQHTRSPCPSPTPIVYSNLRSEEHTSELSHSGQSRMPSSA